MIRRLPSVLLPVLLSVAAPSALAVPIQVTVQSNLLIDEFANTSVFGLFDLSTPIQMSFLLESEGVQSLPAGTAITGGGASASSSLQLVSASSITNFVGQIGNVSFGLTDLNLSHGLGSTGLSYDLLLLGELAENGVLGAAFDFNNIFGEISFGTFVCVAACSLSNNGSVVDHISGGTGTLSGTQVYARVLESEPPTSVPEPATLALFGMGLVGLGLARRRREKR